MGLNKMFNYRLVLMVAGGTAILFGLAYGINTEPIWINGWLAGGLGLSTWVVICNCTTRTQRSAGLITASIGAVACLVGTPTSFGIAVMAILYTLLWGLLNPVAWRLWQWDEAAWWKSLKKK